MLASNPQISVVIPTFNRATFLPQTLESVFAQSFQHHEVVLVDDGSCDGTQERLGPYRERIRYVYQQNRGPSAARNRGIREARGEWIAFLDSDDRWEPHTLETLDRAVRRHPDAGLVAMRSRGIQPDGSKDRRVRGKRSPGPFFSTATLLGADAGGVLTPMVRRSLLLAEGGFDESLQSAEDCDLWIRLSFRTRMICVPEALLLRLRHQGNLTADRGLNARMWLQVLDKLQREHPGFIEAHRDVYRRARGKEHLRLGRELLFGGNGDAGRLGQARSHLRSSLRDHPGFARTYLYLLLSYLPTPLLSPFRASRVRLTADSG